MVCGSDGLLAALVVVSLAAIACSQRVIIHPQGEYDAPRSLVPVKQSERDSGYVRRSGRYGGGSVGYGRRGSYGGSYGGRKYDGLYTPKKGVSPGHGVSTGGSLGVVNVDVGSIVKVDEGSSVSGGKVTAPDAGVDVAEVAEEGCRYYCRTPTDEIYCCESDMDPITRPTVKGGVCPAAEGPCSFLTFVIPCSNDARCPDLDKCCFDSCQHKHVCVPPSSF